MGRESPGQRDGSCVMKALLVPITRHNLTSSVLETALLVARRFESYVEGFALRPALAEYVPVDMVGGLTWIRDDDEDEDAARHARADFERFMLDNGTRNGGRGLSFGWLDKATPGDSFLGHHGRLFDLTIVGRPGTGESDPRMTTLEAALFESGRPILIAPPTPPQTLGDTIVIAWNGSTETARATALAMPMLREAKRIVVLTVESGMVPGPTGEQMANSLRREGLSAEAMKVAPERRSAGEAFLATAGSLGADLLIKGAYTQSRLRQMIFGGATNHILSAATLPVLMAH
jgi:nucleotide-binding universal stress UspA family protein